jgi:hypothetical protein
MDSINAVFELLASVFILNHCRRLYADKIVRGVSALSIAFFLSWGVWNIFYYPSPGQRWSYLAGILVCAANLIWLVMMIYYTQREKHNNALLANGGTHE